MLLYLQFPFTDIRLFASHELRLPRPFWPAPQEPEFIRSFGPIKPRGKGGVQGWVGENTICDAHRIFDIAPFTTAAASDRDIAVRCVAKHFFSDGSAVNKLETVFASRPSRAQLASNGVLNTLTTLVQRPVHVRTSKSYSTVTRLMSVPRHIAAIYARASSPTRLCPSVAVEGYVSAELPMLLVEIGPDEAVNIPKRAQSAGIDPQTGISLSHLWFKTSGKTFRIWLLKYLSSDEATIKRGRVVRIQLMRLHAEKECFRKVLSLIETERIQPVANSIEFDALQLYLTESRQRINHHLTTLDKHVGDGGSLEQLVYQAIETISPGEVESLTAKLKSARIRRQVLANAAPYARRLTEETLPSEIHISNNSSAGTEHIPIADLQQALVAKLPGSAADVRALVGKIITLIGAAGNDASGGAGKIETDPRIIRALQAFAGQEIRTPQATLSFGSENQFGDIAIGDVATGDVIKVMINFNFDHT
jgi:hypothetical protein